MSASSERLKQAAAASLSSVVSAGSNVMVGALIIILATALAALAFTKRRSRAKMRKIEETRWDSETANVYEIYFLLFCRQQTLEGQTPEISVDSGHSFSHTTPSLNLSSDSCCGQHPDVSFTESETSFQDSDPSLRSWCHELPLSSLPQKLPKESCVYQKSESLYQSPSSRLPMSVSGSWRPSPASGDGSVMEGTISFAMSRQDHRNTAQVCIGLTSYRQFIDSLEVSYQSSNKMRWKHNLMPWFISRLSAASPRSRCRGLIQSCMNWAAAWASDPALWISSWRKLVLPGHILASPRNLDIVCWQNSVITIIITRNHCPAPVSCPSLSQRSPWPRPQPISATTSLPRDTKIPHYTDTHLPYVSCNVSSVKRILVFNMRPS